MAHHTKARHCLDVALISLPNAARIHNIYGVLLMDQSEFTKALGHFEAAVANGYSQALLNIATIYEIQGRLDEAVRIALESVFIILT